MAEVAASRITGTKGNLQPFIKFSAPSVCCNLPEGE
jgi:hypothetical protein